MLKAFFLSFIISVSLTPAVRRLAHRYGWLAYPVKDRWHEKATALYGGMAIFIGFGLPLMGQIDWIGWGRFIIAGGRPLGIAETVLMAAAMMFALGLVDDFRRIRPHTKLVGQILAAGVVTALGYRLHWFNSLTLDTMVSLIWLVGITNAFNLLDNMDGLCAGIACISALCMAYLLYPSTPLAAYCAMMMAGALVGFLIYNFNPASIFMGDCGSLTIGFALALLAMACAGADQSALVQISVPILLVLVAIFDTTLVTFIRLLSGRKPSMGGKDHTSHRLILMGFSERGAVLLLYGLGAMAGVAAVFVNQSDRFTIPAVIIPIVVAAVLMGIYLAQLRVYPEKEFGLLRGKTYTPILLELTHKRQIVLVILDFGLAAFVYYLSWRLRFDETDFPYYFNSFLNSLPVVIGCNVGAFYICGVYRGIWRHISAADAFVFIKAATLAALFSVGAVTFLFRFTDFSKGIFVIDWILTIGFLLATRGSFRFFGDSINRRTLCGRQVLIYGAGRGGEILLRELLNNHQLQLKPIGFIDDDPLKNGRRLQGFPVLGGFSDMADVLQRQQPDGILIAIQDWRADRLDAVKSLCRRHRLFLYRFSVHLDPIEIDQI